MFFHFPKLPYTANLLGKIRPEGIVLNVNWNVKYWKEALPALQNATTVNMSNGRCYDLSFLTETHQEVNIRPDGRAISELRACITVSRHWKYRLRYTRGRKAPAPGSSPLSFQKLRPQLAPFTHKNVPFRTGTKERRSPAR